ncbi:MAG: tRNA lysidine(34) synthetase TilS [Actinomycetota bacterium]|nr:tRNA lysidine(34) synthetase TilS [Actinomycetota bacterium]MDP2287729.1 tRNA lysidine(34) synthetase TilS [Actinomycetota bacterium]
MDDRHWASTSTLEVRKAVQLGLRDLQRGSVVLVACSGGPDSLALAAAAAFVGRSLGLTVGAVVVDHQLQESSHQVAHAAQEACIAFDLDPVVIARVDVGSDGGPEAAARTARYEALNAVAVKMQAVAVLLGHTRDDQAETVLLRLARGSGTRSIAAMRPVAGLLRRPLLHLSRELVRASAKQECEALGLKAWEDPHNDEERFARVRLRTALDQLQSALGPGLATGLARSAELAADDADALDAWAQAAFVDLVVFSDDRLEIDILEFAQLPVAIRTRIIRRMCIDLGAVPEDVTRAQVLAVDALVDNWHGQGAVSLPGRVSARREYGRLVLITVLDAGDPVAT